jgi:hypothetical protein
VIRKTDMLTPAPPSEVADLEAEVDALVAEEKTKEEAEDREAALAKALSRRNEEARRNRSLEDWQAELAPLGYSVVGAVWPGCPVRKFAAHAQLDTPFAPVTVRRPWSLTDKGIVYDANGPIPYGRRQTIPANYLVCSPLFQLTRGHHDDRKYYHPDGRVSGGTNSRPSLYAVRTGSKWKTVEVPAGVSPMVDSRRLLDALVAAGLWLNPEPVTYAEIGPSGPSDMTSTSGAELLLRFLDDHEAQAPAP